MAKATKLNTSVENKAMEPPKMSANFTDILNTPMSDIAKPKPRPVGTYVGVVTKAPEIKKIGQKETLAAIFDVKVISPGPDIDASELAAAGGIGERHLRVTQFLTEDALWRLKNFLLALGLEDDGSSIGKLLAETPGRQALFKIKHRPSQDGSELYEEVDSVAAL
jgi:hypothetical protein